METYPEDLEDAVAVIAMALRFPGAQTPGEFWANLRAGVESITFFSEAELLRAGIEPDLLNNPDYVRANGVTADTRLFDASFFGLSDDEATMTDPQHRLLLECSWEALESAGYGLAEQDGPVGMFVGSGESRYFEGIDNPLPWGDSREFLAARVSFLLNLRGPSLTVQTACSTSLVTVHLAAKSLLEGECDMALAGGASIRFPEKTGYLYIEDGIMAPDGHCRSFDRRAQGTVGGNGVGVVVLKRLEDAVEDGDPIRAVLRGSAINNDGADKVGYTAPSVHGQTDVVAAAQAAARVDAETISYIEGHGTATPIGDPIEVDALTQAFRASTQKKGFCALGSVKSNFGHLDSAAGVAGLINTVLALEHEMLPPSLHSESPNPEFNLEDSPFYINSDLEPWRSEAAPRRAGVSSFGIGGTNAHVILEEKPPAVPSSEPSGPSLLLLSARSETALDAATERLIDHFKERPDLNLADVAYTLQVGRRGFRHRRIVVCEDLAQAVDLLERRPARSVATRVSPRQEPEVVFLFSGQGSQYVGMGRELYEREAIFKQQVDLCSEHLRAPLDGDLREILYPPPESEDLATAKLQQTSWTQPALFVIEYALARLWMERGVRPAAMIGHSIGEYVAACLAGVFSLPQALELVAARGELMQRLPAGNMLAVALEPAELEKSLNPDLSLAAVNGAQRSVASGPPAAIDALEADLEGRGVLFRRLKTSRAFHSAMVEPILEPFAKHLEGVELQAPEIPVISNLTGVELTAEEATDPQYWCRHLRQTVRFADGARRLAETDHRIFLEVGPGRTLATLLQEILKDAPGHRVATSLRHPKERRSDREHLWTTHGRLWLAGVTIDWRSCHAGERRCRLPLPTYPFERKPFWIERASEPLPSETKSESVELPIENITEAPSSPSTEAPAPAPKTPRVAEDQRPAEEDVEQIIARQLEIITQQLELLSQEP